MKRPFRGLRRAPDPHYDVVVIGAGIGGLVAANLLARQGARTLLVEQHYMLGGYCSTFRRGGYTFDAATHFYPLLGNPETLTGRLLVELGVETGWVKMDPVDTFHFPDGWRFAVPADFAAYLAAVKAAFPAQAGALDAFFAVARETYMLGLLHYFRGRPLAQLERLRPWVDVTVRQALERYFDDPRLRLLLAADCPHWGSPPGRTSFVFDSMLRLSYFLGNYYPRGGSQAFADELGRVFEARGGHLLTSTVARRILVEPGDRPDSSPTADCEAVRRRPAAMRTGCGRPRAGAVELEVLRGDRPPRDRYRVSADAILANGDLLATYRDLVGAAHLPTGTLEQLAALRPSYPCFLIHLGLEGVPDQQLEELQGYYWDSWEMDEVGRDALRFKLFSPTLYEPAMAPPGRQILIIQKVLDQDVGAVADWPAHKQAVTERALAGLERLAPGVGRRVVVQTSASALTSWRFTGNSQGAMLGFEMAPDQLGDARPDVVSPLADLYLAGHWTRPGGGITPVIVSAQRAVAALTATTLAAASARGADSAIHPATSEEDVPDVRTATPPGPPSGPVTGPLDGHTAVPIAEPHVDAHLPA